MPEEGRQGGPERADGEQCWQGLGGEAGQQLGAGRGEGRGVSVRENKRAENGGRDGREGASERQREEEGKGEGEGRTETPSNPRKAIVFSLGSGPPLPPVPPCLL